MAEPKTQPTQASVDAFLAAVPEPARRRDAQALDRLLREVSGEAPVMWGSSIVGYGRYEVAAAGGRSVAWPIVGFSPRKTALTLYLMPGFEGHDTLLRRLGRHTVGKSCLYLKKLDDAEPAVLRQLLELSIAAMRARHPAPAARA